MSAFTGQAMQTGALGRVAAPNARASTIPKFQGMRAVSATTGSRSVAMKKADRKSVVVRAESDEGLSPLEILRRENELLRQTINAATESMESFEPEPEAAPAAAPVAAATATAPPPANNTATITPGVPMAPYTPAPVGEEAILPYPSIWNIGGPDGLSLSELPYHMKIPGTNWSPILDAPANQEFVEEYGPMSQSPAHDGTECLKWDDSLWSHAGHFQHRWGVYNAMKDNINNAGGMDKFSQAYKEYGINRMTLPDGRTGLLYKEYAPAARAVALVGDFNNWQAREQDWATKDESGTWSVFFEDLPDGTAQIPHKSNIKARVENCNGEWNDRIPAYIRWATQPEGEIAFNGNVWDPPKGKNPTPGVLEEGYTYTFKYPRPEKPRALRIYECHVGMSSIDPKVNSYNEFRTEVLPRIRNLGYNALQIMAVQEHAYYGSFGYHVTNFFGVSSRCGTPEDLKALIDEAHRLGLVVLMDIVHSHASNNTIDGINNFDGSDYLFHAGARGYHWMWDSRLFNYGHWETMRYLLSNSRYWLDEYKFDGYRFDGVTSMMYHHHGLQMAFTGNYNEYFGMDTDVDAVVYMMLANDMMHSFFPNVVTIGEDVSGMPTFCRPVAEGGVGFDYRLQMSIADKWIDQMEIPDENWGMWDLTHCLGNRRYMEACVGYAESHDQALVGDKTIAFHLMDKDMYDFMAAPGFGESSQIVDRGMALHKLIRLITMVLGGESYLNFMGNEFGHPEWIDFPRVASLDPSTGETVPGNGGSFEKCRRRFDLADADYLKYNFLCSFDRAMCHLDKAFGFMGAAHTYISRKDDADKMIVVERGDLVFVFNFHPSNTYEGYRVGCLNEGPYKVVLSSDEKCFYGWENVTKYNDVTYLATGQAHDDRPASFQCSAPSRTVVVYAPAEHVDSMSEEIPGLAVKGNGPYWAM